MNRLLEFATKTHRRTCMFFLGFGVLLALYPLFSPFHTPRIDPVAQLEAKLRSAESERAAFEKQARTAEQERDEARAAADATLTKLVEELIAHAKAVPAKLKDPLVTSPGVAKDLVDVVKTSATYSDYQTSATWRGKQVAIDPVEVQTAFLEHAKLQHPDIPEDKVKATFAKLRFQSDGGILDSESYKVFSEDMKTWR